MYPFRLSVVERLVREIGLHPVNSPVIQLVWLVSVPAHTIVISLEHYVIALLTLVSLEIMRVLMEKSARWG